jgi:hypothetical protein
MADNEERRMLFDLRGRRKNVIRVIYAALAILMGGSLFVAVGPFNLAELVGTGSSGSADQIFDEQVERIEGRLAKDPNDEAQLLALTRARISAGNARSEIDPETGTAVATPQARADFDAALKAWERYLSQTDEPNPIAAQLVASTFFSLAESSSAGLTEIEENVATAAAAQRIAAEERPNPGSLSSLAIYEYFAGNFAAGDRAASRAAASVPAKAEAKQVEEQMTEFRQRAKQFQKQSRQFTRAQREAGAGAEALQNPLGGFGGQ